MTDYQSGFGNGFATEALPRALPVGLELTPELPLRYVRRAAERLTFRVTPTGEYALSAHID